MCLVLELNTWRRSVEVEEVDSCRQPPSRNSHSTMDSHNMLSQKGPIKIIKNYSWPCIAHPNNPTILQTHLPKGWLFLGTFFEWDSPKEQTSHQSDHCAVSAARHLYQFNYTPWIFNNLWGRAGVPLLCHNKALTEDLKGTTCSQRR